MDAGDLSKQTYRDGMARLGASVNVVTSDGVAGRVGFTATSVCSLSDTPPSLLVCMNRSSTQNAPLKANGVLCVNILAPEHRDLSAALRGSVNWTARAVSRWRRGRLFKQERRS